MALYVAAALPEISVDAPPAARSVTKARYGCAAPTPIWYAGWLPSHTSRREIRAPAAAAFPDVSTPSTRSSGTPHAPAAEFTDSPKLCIRLAACESAPTMNRVPLALRTANRATPTKPPVHVAAP